MASDILPGKSHPLGAAVYPDGVNFCIYSHNGAAVELLLYDDVNDTKPRVLRFDPKVNKTFYYWHMFVRGIIAGQLYGYRVYGPMDPGRGMRFDGEKVLLDPYALAVAKCPHYDRQAAMRPGDNCGQALKAVVVDPSTYDWQDDHPPHIPYSRTIIYEMHVGGFTRHPSSEVTPQKRGTYDGLVEKIPYLKSLGITAVELLPVQQFDEQDGPTLLKNYWGYSPLAFFAPHNGYSHRSGPLGAIDEFRDMVRALHKAGIEVILDVVFNHTNEGDHRGPTLSFKGLENAAYYILEENPAIYANFTGCGNTVNANYSIVRRLITDCLCHWVVDMHVDGFRFDLASAMARGENGQPLVSPPLLWSIDSDPVLAGAKIIAEAWDAAGLYQVGSFIGDRFSEWNGQFRDDVRRFIRGDNGITATVAARIMGSPDIYVKPDREPNRSINFITCHDGFTMKDLVSYNVKHNENNQQNNVDGADGNFSWNCGVEGPSDDDGVEELRLRHMKNFFTMLLTSQGTPMMLMGDEIGRSQQGNNNAYCQDNALSWMDWSGVESNAGLLLFVKKLIRFVQGHPMFQQERLLTTGELGNGPSITWHGVALGKPDWGDQSHTLAFTLVDPRHSDRIHIIFNAYWEDLVFDLPGPMGSKQWRRIVDSAKASPEDCYEQSDAPVITSRTYTVTKRSAVVLLEK